MPRSVYCRFDKLDGRAIALGRPGRGAADPPLNRFGNTLRKGHSSIGRLALFCCVDFVHWADTNDELRRRV